MGPRQSSDGPAYGGGPDQERSREAPTLPPHPVPGVPTEHPPPPQTTLHLLASPTPLIFPVLCPERQAFSPPGLRSSGDTGQDTPNRLSDLGYVSPPWGPRHVASPQLHLSPLHSLRRTPTPNPAPCRTVPVSLTRRQGEEAERKDGAIHTVALPPRARPHHVLDPRLQLAQQRLSPAAALRPFPRRFHGAPTTGKTPECLRRRQGTGWGRVRAESRAGTRPDCDGSLWAPSASGPEPQNRGGNQ